MKGMGLLEGVFFDKLSSITVNNKNKYGIF